jgi:FkbM family methyltransferase
MHRINSEIKQLIRNFLGFQPFINKEEQSYTRLAEKGFKPDGIIDVGAYQGDWARLACRVFPNVHILMIEAQELKRPFLDKVCTELPYASYESTILGANSGELLTFYEMETGSSFLPEQSNAPRTSKQMITKTLDEVASKLAGNDLFLKIDVQGAELQVLAGGEATLKRSAVVQLEVAMLAYNAGAPTILEVLNYMNDRGFVPFDISGESRPKGHLVQIDILFTPRSSSLRPTFINF